MCNLSSPQVSHSHTHQNSRHSHSSSSRRIHTPQGSEKPIVTIIILHKSTRRKNLKALYIVMRKYTSEIDQTMREKSTKKLREKNLKTFPHSIFASIELLERCKERIFVDNLVNVYISPFFYPHSVDNDFQICAHTLKLKICLTLFPSLSSSHPRLATVHTCKHFFEENTTHGNIFLTNQSKSNETSTHIICFFL